MLSVNNAWSDENNNSNSPKLSVDEAVNMVRSQYADGKILKTTTENNGNQTKYVIKVITADSRVLHITVDAQSGQMNQ
ncbi:MAG: PepSY domain-containing protein [Gammaproteobacteria bacterium]|nr:PepSY domain-containing protein [Gammaproteobacteria bacterium]